MAIEITRADYSDKAQARTIVGLLDIYARDQMGGGQPLPEHVKENLVAGLIATPTAFTKIAWVDGTPAGLINCLFGYSTFAAKPLINIHDLVTVPSFRGRGVARALMKDIETVAIDAGCCKVTLEVLSGNEAALALYRDLGYSDYILNPDQGSALFWQLRL